MMSLQGRITFTLKRAPQRSRAIAQFWKQGPTFLDVSACTSPTTTTYVTWQISLPSIDCLCWPER